MTVRLLNKLNLQDC